MTGGGCEARGGAVEFTFEGMTIAAREGENLAAVLAEAGHLVLRSTRKGAARGVFCGMGVCRDCLVDIGERRNLRACMTKVEPDMAVRRAGGPGTPVTPRDAPPHVLLDALGEETPDIFVIGAGPAGMAAALAARETGARVVLADERARPGGQFFKQMSSGMPIDSQQAEGRRLVEKVRASGIELWPETLVWGAFEPLVFAVNRAGGTTIVRPRAAVYAGGAFERPWPVPGWTLPGVMTTGAAQTMWRTDRRLPGKRVLIAGNGPLNLQVATELAAGGADAVAIAESAPVPRSILDAARMGVSAPNLVLQGLRYLRACRKAGTPLLHGSHLASVSQTGSRLQAVIAGDHERVFEVDAVCLGYGFLPSNDLLRAIGARAPFDPAKGHPVVERDTEGATSVAGLFAAGDCIGLGGARVALADGTIAGAAAARYAGFGTSAAVERAVRKARAQAGRHRRFQSALWSIYTPSVVDAPWTADTIICRCEEMRFGDALAALDEGQASAGAIKRRTRIGMGHCQGRYCGWLLSSLLAQNGRPGDEYSGFAPRLPAKPVSIASLSRGPGGQ